MPLPWIIIAANIYRGLIGQHLLENIQIWGCGKVKHQSNTTLTYHIPVLSVTTGKLAYTVIRNGLRYC